MTSKKIAWFTRLGMTGASVGFFVGASFPNLVLPHVMPSSSVKAHNKDSSSVDERFISAVYGSVLGTVFPISLPFVASKFYEDNNNKK